MLMIFNVMLLENSLEKTYIWKYLSNEEVKATLLRVELYKRSLNW